MEQHASGQESGLIRDSPRRLDKPTGTNEPAWAENVAATSFPPLAEQLTADVCVVGLGGSGLSCINELLKLGQRVVGLDAGIVAGGAAGRNGGFLLAGTSAFYHEAVAALGRERARRIYEITLAEMDRIQAEVPNARPSRRIGAPRSLGNGRARTASSIRCDARGWVCCRAIRG